jgi:hypothetical protein
MHMKAMDNKLKSLSNTYWKLKEISPTNRITPVVSRWV